MAFISSASSNSKSRGYDYYLEKKIKNVRRISDNEFEGTALGSNNNKYEVHIDLIHPKKNSTCTCPHAEANKVMCKHKVALYFSIFEVEAQKYKEEIEKQEMEYEEYEEELSNSIYSTVMSLNKDDLQNALIEILEQSPEWLCENFIMEYDRYK